LIAPIELGCADRTIELLRRLREKSLTIPTLAILPPDSDEQLLRLVSDLASDFAIWPTRREEIQQRAKRLLGYGGSEADIVRDRLLEQMRLGQLVGKDPGFIKLLERIPLIARSNSPVLITGETGTGKELSARAIHHLGRRRDFPFIAVDCAAFPDQLFENELFGHARGAFTDAHRDQRGLIAMAEGGTLFLDEIDSLSPSSQAKLLRFLQERTYRPLGADKFVRADLNVVAATNRDLDKMVRDNQFRSDLFFRLNVLRLHMMPLRDRRGDIVLLAKHFLELLATEQGVPRKTLASSAVAQLLQSDWPGNVRELYNLMQRAIVFARGPQIMPADILPPSTDSSTVEAIQPANGFRQARAQAIEAFERRYLIDALKQHNGNITQSARYALQDRRAFGRLVKRHGIDRNSV
jgi:DNA-binding NtrC family response regulator